VPIGAFLRLLFRRRGSSRVSEWIGALAVAAGLSYFTEVAQTVLPARVPSWTDTFSNFGGAVMGIILAPPLQRLARNLHAALFYMLRHRPFAAAAAITMIGLWIHALAPFDIHPTPTHVQRSIQSFQQDYATLRIDTQSWQTIPAGVGFRPYTGLEAPAMFNKLVAAGSFGLLAVLLTFSAREAGRGPLGSAWYACSRATLLALVIEAIQLFTISHVADPRDLAMAWCCCLAGAMSVQIVLIRWPDLQRRPATVLRGLVLIIAATLVLWTAAILVHSQTRDTIGPTTWLPVVGSFDRTWDGLLGDYTRGLFQYLLVGALVAMWYRSHHRAPSAVTVVGGAFGAAVIMGVLQAVCRSVTPDTTQLLLAVIAAVCILRLDRALWSVNRGREDTLRSSARV
jgi:glycopeptide antibiotics resistance protein